MTAVELYRAEKARAIAKGIPVIQTARKILERVCPVTRQNYDAKQAAYYQANKDALKLKAQVRRASKKIGRSGSSGGAK